MKVTVARLAIILGLTGFTPLVLAADPSVNSPTLPREQDLALRDRVKALYVAWGAKDWLSMFKLVPPGDQECGHASQLADILGDEREEVPTQWKILRVRADPTSPHHKEPSECSQKVWAITAVALVDLTVTFKQSDGSLKTGDRITIAWLLIDGQWYWSMDELL